MRAIGDPHVHPVVLHRRVQELLEHGPQPVDLVDEEDVVRLERGEQPHEVPGPLEHGSGGGADVDAQLLCHQQRERGLAEAGGTEKERVIERLATLFRRVDRDLEGFLYLRLADEFVEPRGA